MKTAEQWRTEAGHLTTKPVHPKFFEQAVIGKIQKDARNAGLKKASELADAYLQSMGTKDGMAVAALIKQDILAEIEAADRFAALGL